MKKRILFIDDDLFMSEFIKGYFETAYDIQHYGLGEQGWLATQTGYRPDLILLDLQLPDADGQVLLGRFKSQAHLADIPIIILSAHDESQYRINALRGGAEDYLVKPFNPEELTLKLEKYLGQVKKPTAPSKLWRNSGAVVKRLFDIAFAGLVLILISPFLALIAVAIKLDSKGPVFYTSKRVGRNYQVFDFYKFRSMRVGADHLVKSMKQANAYTTGHPQEETPLICEQCQKEEVTHFVSNSLQVCEHYLLRSKQQQQAFFKVSNDPRVTALGRFLRNTSIDELPQLFNVLKGEMSLVGNRPLPLYEAEQLTRDSDIKRFDAPAGITGLWQVTKRGKAKISETERKELDKEYAHKANIWMDARILMQTVPALFQQENV